MKASILLKFVIVLNLVWLSWLGQPILAQDSSGPESHDLVTVEAQGSGLTKLEALKAAWAEAVKLGLGLFLVSKTTLIDDSYTEQIISSSRGKVDSYQEIESKQVDNIWTVKIRAKIEKVLLEETAQVYNSRSSSLKGPEFADMVKNQLAYGASTRDQQSSQLELLNFLMENYKIKEAYQLNQIKVSSANHKLTIDTGISINTNKYLEIVNNLKLWLDQVAVEKVIDNYYQADVLTVNRDLQNNQQGEINGLKGSQAYRLTSGQRQALLKNSDLNLLKENDFTVVVFIIPDNFSKYTSYKVYDRVIVSKLREVFSNYNYFNFYNAMINIEVLKDNDLIDVNQFSFVISRLIEFKREYMSITVNDSTYECTAEIVYIQPYFSVASNVDSIRSIKEAYYNYNFNLPLEIKNLDLLADNIADNIDFKAALSLDERRY
ncbi:MAG: hypothetical protein LBE80_04685 [Deltaproteobacteria bacterium]|jgi:hypothetical protein|nr:hypothetical protein [Deltaproteobacteria bacterium]